MFKRSHHINLAHRWIEKPAELIRTELLCKRWHDIDTEGGLLQFRA